MKATINLGFLSVLTCILAAGKVFGFISLSWFTVFLPVLIPFFIGGLVSLLALCVFILYGLACAITGRRL